MTKRHVPISSDGVPRVIGRIDSFAIVAGSMLGIGIFLSPSIVATHISSPLGFFAVWTLGGLISLAGAVACAELGTMMPRAGGDYVIQYEAYGPSVAFASGWVLFAAIFCGSIATMVVGLCTYQLPVLLGLDLSATAAFLPGGLAVSWTQLASIGLVVALTALNTTGAYPSARTQSALTIVPIVVFAMLGIILLSGVVTTPAQRSGATMGSAPFTWHGLMVAYMAVYFAYSGWINVIYVAGEIEEPQTNIPRALIRGTLVVTALYLVLCAGFVAALGYDGVRNAGEAGSATAAMIGGEVGRFSVTVLIASALLASVNATILGGARVAFAMAQRGAALESLARVGEHGRVPNRALWLQAVISCALIVSGRFEDLYTMVSLSMVVTGTLTVGAIFVLRARQPDRQRPYRASGYPLLPALYVASSMVAVVVMVHRAVSGEPRAWYPLLGAGILVVIWLVHRFAATSSIAPPAGQQ
jgi:APA family basic amino acid/polyamine antiporter